MNPADYYIKQMALPEVGVAGQEKLQHGKCLVIGAGGLGSAALFYLAAAGVGKIGICDADCVEISNLHRQILYQLDDLDCSKAVAAANRLRKVNPLIEIIPYQKRLTHANCADLLSGYDLILDCSDNYETKYLLNDASFLFHKPVIRASIHRFEGQLQCYLPQRSDACLRCHWPEIPQESCPGSCEEVGVLGPLPGFFGLLQAMEALKFFLKLPLLSSSALLTYDLITHSQRIMHLTHHTECPLCGKDPKITCLQASPFWEVRSDTHLSKFCLVDIREAEEVEKDPLKGLPYLHHPLSQFDAKKLSANLNYLFFCRSGKRSHHLVAKLRSQGWTNAYSLIGGLPSLFS